MSKDNKKSFLCLRNRGFEDYRNILMKIMASVALEIDQLFLKFVWEPTEP